MLLAVTLTVDAMSFVSYATTTQQKIDQAEEDKKALEGQLDQTQQELDKLFQGQLEDIYTVRVRALDELLTKDEFARILIHLSQRRGFRSNRKNPSDGDEGAILSAVNENKVRMESAGYRTVGEMLLRDERFAEQKRNKGGQYIATVSRAQTEEEVRLIFRAQRDRGAVFASAEIEEAYLAILLSQRSFDEGPGGDSPYGGNQIEKMAGKCTFHPELPRAAKATYSFEYFNLLEKINHLRIFFFQYVEKEQETHISCSSKIISNSSRILSLLPVRYRYPNIVSTPVAMRYAAGSAFFDAVTLLALRPFRTKSSSSSVREF